MAMVQSHNTPSGCEKPFWASTVTSLQRCVLEKIFLIFSPWPWNYKLIFRQRHNTLYHHQQANATSINFYYQWHWPCPNDIGSEGHKTLLADFDQSHKDSLCKVSLLKLNWYLRNMYHPETKLFCSKSLFYVVQVLVHDHYTLRLINITCAKHESLQYKVLAERERE